MLKLVGITKDYAAGDTTVKALKGIDLKFRSSEFVSILGPSGCGKTTLLNIIGGLDQYTDGDLFINGKSTKLFKDRDWDTYRNHSIGFVFQSYNLISHQTILQNVELALTLSGVSKSERKERAKKALAEVGLGNQLHKKPNQMSGGQMQRVAIARALVNDPDIILADEPTGALDTETSIQVMEILKKISKHRLIIMVTHNPELAEKYSTRIVRMLDGKIVDDSKPLTEKECKFEDEKDKETTNSLIKRKKSSMSFPTAFKLSLKNLITKKGRTVLTSFAGSIGIIGIALILSVSQGMTGYINSVQEETLSSYPLTIEKKANDLTSLISSIMNVDTDEGGNHENDAVYKKEAIYEIFNAIANMDSSENDLKSFKTFLDNKLQEEDTDFYSAVSGVQYSYNLNPIVYTQSVDGNIIQSDTSVVIQELLSGYLGSDFSNISSSMGNMSDLSSMSSMFGGSSLSANLWQEMLVGKNGDPVNDLLKKQYDVVYGSWPNSYDEVALVLNKNNEIDDLALYALGFESKDEIDKIKDAVINGKPLDKKAQKWKYADICGKDFKIVLNSDCYAYNESSQTITDLRKTDAGIKYLYDNGTTLRVSGIIKQNDSSQSSMLTGSIVYTKMLTDYMVEKGQKSELVNMQLANKEMDIFTGLPFKSNINSLTNKEKADELKEHITTLDESGKAEMYIRIKSIPSEEQLNSMTDNAMEGYTREQIEAAIIAQISEQMGMDEETVKSYISSMSDEELKAMFREGVKAEIKARYATQVRAQINSQLESGEITTAQLAAGLTYEISSCDDKQCAIYHDEVMEFSTSTYEENLEKLGYVELDSPSAINIYASSFENKELIEKTIDDYNKSVNEYSQIKYTDYVGLMMSSVVTIINSITYVLIAFVAISLIVSSIMIGVITLISVQERTKEIGILRAIGASKHDVSSMFNAETLIIGFASGMLGVMLTYVLCLPINLILHAVTGLTTLNALLPWWGAVALIVISMALTLIAGIIPSRSAAKKDPVVALRTE